MEKEGKQIFRIEVQITKIKQFVDQVNSLRINADSFLAQTGLLLLLLLFVCLFVCFVILSKLLHILIR